MQLARRGRCDSIVPVRAQQLGALCEIDFSISLCEIEKKLREKLFSCCTWNDGDGHDLSLIIHGEITVLNSCTL